VIEYLKTLWLQEHDSGKTPGKTPERPSFLQQAIVHLERVNGCPANR
jgi:hypothetical protein